MKVVTAKEMQDVDRRAIEVLGIPGSVLMERAGLSVAEKIKELFEPGKVIVLAGSGNNGGDGIVIGRELHNSGWHAKVLLLLKEDKLSPDCLAQYRVAKQVGVPIDFRTTIDAADTHAAIVVDAIFGTGLSKDITGPMAETIDSLNASSAPVISVDIPSGISSDTGRVMGTAVKARATVTFGAPKRGHLLHPGVEHTGELYVEDIGFPPGLFDDLKCNVTEPCAMARLLPERPRFSHKGSYGHVLVVAGSKGKTGAALMATRACLVTGAGMVTLGVPESLLGVFQSRVTEEMCLPLPGSGSGTLSRRALGDIMGFLNKDASVLAIGPGIGTDEETSALVRELLGACTVPVVADADALNAFEGKAGSIKEITAPLVVTPHPGEFARMTGMSKEDVEADRISSAQSFSRDYGVTVVLKGVPTVIADPEGNVYLNTTGNPAMAKAGAGDVLTGMLAAFLAQGLTPTNASALGAYMHGLAGDMAAEELGPYSVLASDITDSIPRAFKSLRQV